MLNYLAVGAGGFVGAVLRYLVSMIPLDKTGAFPVNTLLINILGAFAIGAITALGAKTAGLMQSGRIGASAAYMLLSVTLSVAAVLLSEAVV